MIILSIDPSLMNRCGWATYDTEKDEWNWGYWEAEGMNYKVRCIDLKDRINETVPEWHELVAEWPMYYDSQEGRIAAQKGYTINLAGLIMYLMGWFELKASQMYHYTAPQWKGSVPKQVTARRFLKLFGEQYHNLEHDVIDAIMLLLHHLKEKRILGS